MKNIFQNKNIKILSLFLIFFISSIFMSSCTYGLLEEGQTFVDIYSGIKVITVADDEYSSQIYLDKNEKLALEILVEIYNNFGASLSTQTFYVDNGVAYSGNSDSNIYYTTDSSSLGYSNLLNGDGDSESVWGIYGGFSAEDELGENNVLTFINYELIRVSSYIISAQQGLSYDDMNYLISSYDTYKWNYAKQLDYYGYTDEDKENIVEYLLDIINPTNLDSSQSSQLEDMLYNTFESIDNSESRHPLAPRYYIEDIILDGVEINMEADNYVSFILMPAEELYNEFLILSLSNYDDILDLTDMTMSVEYVNSTNHIIQDGVVNDGDSFSFDFVNYDNFSSIYNNTYDYTSGSWITGVTTGIFTNNTPSIEKTLVGDGNSYQDYFMQVESDVLNKKIFQYYDNTTQYLNYIFNSISDLNSFGFYIF